MPKDMSKSHRDLQRNKVGNDFTAGNSVVGRTHSPGFQSSTTTAVAKQERRFKKTRTRR